MIAADVIKMAQENNVKFIDLVFGDMFGALQHFTIPAACLTEELFVKGQAFDGSSIRGWKSIDKSDMLMVPDAASAFVDPFREVPVLTLFCSIKEPRSGEKYSRDPRSIAEKAVAYLQKSGIGDKANFGPEPEFFVFDSVSYSSKPESSYYVIDSEEAHWNSGEETSMGRNIRAKHGYAPASPTDTLFDLRNEISLNLNAMGVETEVHHHEVASAGQCEVGTKYNHLVAAGDQVFKLKYCVKNTAAQHGLTATFMPKPIFGDNGSGMHVHSSIWKDDKNLYAGDIYEGLSQEALWAIGGVLKHAKALQAIINPSINSYKRLVPGYEAPVNLAYSATNRSASIRIPFVEGDAARRFEFRCPDASGSPHLVFAALLMASIDGIKNKIDPGEPLDKNIYEMSAEELKEIPSTCHSLEEALDTLEANFDFLLEGGVFSKDMLEAYIDFKRKEEVLPAKMRPNPFEFELYFDC